MQEFQKSIKLLKETALAKKAQPKPPQGPPPRKLLKPKVEYLAERQTNKAKIRTVVGEVLSAYGRNEPGQSSQARFIPRTVAESCAFQGTAVPQARIGTSSKARPSSRILPQPKKKRMRLRAKAIY